MAGEFRLSPFAELANRFPLNAGTPADQMNAALAYNRMLPTLLQQSGERQQQEALLGTQANIKQQQLTNPPISDLLRSLTGGAGGTGGAAAPAAAPIVQQPRVSIGSLPAVGAGGIVGVTGGGAGAVPTAGGGGGGGVPTAGGIDFSSFRGLLDQILQPLLANLAPQEASARTRLEDAFRLAGGGAGPGSLQGPLLESIRRQEEGFMRERLGAGASAALSVLQPFLGAGVATRGQDIGAGVATRGQDITADTASRGQAIERLIAELNAGVTQRGQDITQELGRTIPPGAPLSSQTALLQTLLSQIL